MGFELCPFKVILMVIYAPIVLMIEKKVIDDPEYLSGYGPWAYLRMGRYNRTVLLPFFLSNMASKEFQIIAGPLSWK